MSEAAVIRVVVPNPFFEGATNVYALRGSPLTLIDAGIGTEEAFAALEQGLRSHGLDVAAIRQVVLTHYHLDHFGLAWKIREVSGARIFVHREDWEAVTRYEDWQSQFHQRMRERLGEWEAPVAEVEALAALLQRSVRRLGRSAPAEPLSDGQRLPGPDGALEILHTPGHSPGSICIRSGRSLFSGDHVLPDVSPNIGGDLTSSGLLRRYLASLERVKPLEAEGLRVYPGHGAPFHDLAERAHALQDHHLQREEAIVRLLEARGPQTIYEIASGLFGRLRDYHLVLGTGEVHAHLEKLLAEDRVLERGRRFAARPTGARGP